MRAALVSGAPARPSAGARGAARALAFYKKFVSPLLPPACRFSPTCSEYAQQAVLRHGLRRGLALAARRLSRCHPFNAGGHDPVP